MPPNTFEFYRTSEETWESMLVAIRGAQSSIDIEHYIFASDKIGDQFIEILKEKSKRGVKIRLLIDTVGSYAFYIGGVPEELRQLGIQVRFFNPISPWRIPHFTSWFFRDHKKIIVVDRKIGFTGGLGIRDNMAGWRDTNARLEGEMVGEMAESFKETWEQLGDKNLLSKIKRFRINAKKRFFITNAPYFKKRFLYYAFIEALRSARKSIWLTTPYFIPDRRLLRVLRQAVRRGVDVKVIVPTILDVPIVATAAHSAFEELLKGGVKIFKYHPKFLHAKTAVVDDEWATFGSFNFDSLSFVYNFEANVVSTALECVKELKEHFLEDLGSSFEITLENWMKRPLLRKVQEFFIAPIRGFL